MYFAQLAFYISMDGYQKYYLKGRNHIPKEEPSVTSGPWTSPFSWIILPGDTYIKLRTCMKNRICNQWDNWRAYGPEQML